MRNLQIAVAMKVKLNREVRFFRGDHELYPILMETQTLCGVDIVEASDLIAFQGYTVRSMECLRQDLREYAIYWLLTVLAFQTIVALILVNLEYNPYILGVGAVLLLIGFILEGICVYICLNGCKDTNGTCVLLKEGAVISPRGDRIACNVDVANVDIPGTG